jgi:signal transduction histidine kinase
VTEQSKPPAPSAEQLHGEGMSARVAALDWSQTPLGPAEAWPQSLRSALSICLGSGFPIAIYWGPELVLLYNDAWSPIPGAKHPWALGRPGREVWSEIWSIISPLFEQVLTTGRATRSEDQLLPMRRHGYTEECYFDYTFSPIRGEAGEVAGVFNAVVETTYRVLAERRARLLRRLAEKVAAVRSVDEVFRITAEALAEGLEDIPFCLLYRNETGSRGGEGGYAHLVALAGLDAASPAAPPTVAAGDEGALWPLAEAAAGRSVMVLDLDAKLGTPLPGGPWPEPTTTAVVAPVANTSRPGTVAGFLVCGISPRLALDEDYWTFLEGIASQVATAVAVATASEEDRKRAEQLAEIDRAKTAFFSNVSHEFRTPLTLMLGPLEELIARSDEISPASRELLAVAYRNSQRLLRLVNSLLDFTRIEAGRAQASFEPVDLAAHTADLASVFRAAIEKAGMRLVVACRPLSEPVYVDRDMWEKIVLNLVSNAFKYTLEGEIEVSLGEYDGNAVFSVRDTGIGIPEAELPYLFNRFHRVEGARGRTQEGSGIGLALVQELVALHGGSVRVDSVEGEGSTFTVHLPLGSAHLAADRIGGERALATTALGAGPFVEEALRWVPGSDGPDAGALGHEPSPRARGTRRRARVLLADDNADMRDYVARLLEAEYDVEAVADGERALEAALARPPDLVLSDVMMPRLDGFGLLERLRADERLRTVPVILLSARAGEESRVEGLEAGADDYLVKPFGARELLARVSANLEMARMRREAAERERALRERAEEASRAKDEFLATVSHELRTPLNSMLGWARLLRAGRLDPVAAARALETIERNTVSQAQLIEDLLDISRIITGKMRLAIQPITLESVVRAAIDSIRPAADAKDIRVHVSLDAFKGRILGDPERLQQVVWNLVSNAVKFTPRGGSVSVAVASEAAQITLSVVDTGSGIPSDFLPFVFDRFRQADASMSREHGGLGLGLAIVRHIVELHGGTVDVASDGVGRGSTFTVRLPISRTPSGSYEPARGATPSASLPSGEYARLDGLRVLAVDDEADTRELILHVLEMYGAEVRLADSVREARAILAAPDDWKPDVLVSDIGMPGEDGYMLIQEVRSHVKEWVRRVPALALTAYARAEDRARLLSAGFESHLSKPVELSELVAVVESLARRS